MDPIREKAVRDSLAQADLCPTTGTPADLCQRVESELISLIKAESVKCIEASAANATLEFQVQAGDRFRYGDHWYTASLSVDNEGSTLTIVLRSVDRKDFNKNVKRRTTRLHTAGRYSLVKSICDDRLGAVVDDLHQIASTILVQGYRWLEAELTELLISEREEVAAALYLHLRTCLPDAAVPYAWFLAIVDGKAVSLPDRSNIKGGIERASNRIIMVKESPLELVGELLYEPFDYDTTFSKDAIGQGSPIDVDLRMVRYSDSGLQASEEAIYECQGVTVHPLVSEGAALLTLVYPTTLKAQIAHRVDLDKDSFKSLIGQKKANVASILERLGHIRSSQQKSPLDVMYHTGRFFSGLFGIPQATPGP